MRLWHSKLIPLLDGRRLCDLHMSCCNLRGKGWGKRNKNINYIYDDELGEDALTVYHHIVIKEMERRGYKYDSAWVEAGYCGKNRPRREPSWSNYKKACLRNVPLKGHTLAMFKSDVDTLQQRGLPIEITHTTGYDYDCAPYVVYTVSNTDRKIQYGIRL